MTHLGDRVAALVDGQLPPEVAERWYAHLATCAACREAVELERLTKHRLATLPDVQPGADLLATLMRIGGPDGPLPPRPGHVPGTARPQTQPLDPGPAGSRRPSGSPAPASRGTGGIPVSWPDSQGQGNRGQGSRGPGRRGAGGWGPGSARRDPRRRIAAAVLGALSVVGLGVVALAAVSTAGAGTQVAPPVDSFVANHAVTTGVLLFGDRQVGWLTGGEGDK